MIEGFHENAIVIVNLASPKEKFWGVLRSISASGFTIRGINLDTFHDWVGQIAQKQEPTLDLVTMFFPLFRLERLFLDEPVGAVKSYSEYFEETVGISPEEYLGLVSPGGGVS